MNKINRLLFALMAIILASCETNVIDDSDNIVAGFDFPTTETTDDYSVTFQYKDGVIVLDDKAQTYLVRVEADTILYFSNNPLPPFYLMSVMLFLQESQKRHLMD